MEFSDLGRLAYHGDTEIFPGALDFAVNVRGAAPPEWLAETLRQTVGRLGAYPSRDETARVRATVAAHHDVAPESVLLLSGASEAFTLVAAHVAKLNLAAAAQLGAPPRRAVLIHPSYTEPEAAFRRAAVPVRRLVLDPPFALPHGPADATGTSPVPPAAAGFVSSLDDAACVLCGNPTNPTSLLHPAAAVAALGSPGRILVVDEAFMDVAVPANGTVAEAESLAGRTDPGLLVVRSLTKTWALAGLRVGYAVGDPELVRALEAGRPPWHLGTLQLAAFGAVFSAQGQAELGAERERVAIELTEMCRLLDAAGIELATRPAAPFVLAEIPAGCPAAEFRAALAEQGIAVRRCDTFPGLDWDRSAEDVAERASGGRGGVRGRRQHVRLALRPAAQVQQLVTAWDEAARRTRRAR